MARWALTRVRACARSLVSVLTLSLRRPRGRSDADSHGTISAFSRPACAGLATASTGASARRTGSCSTPASAADQRLRALVRSRAGRDACRCGRRVRPSCARATWHGTPVAVTPPVLTRRRGRPAASVTCSPGAWAGGGWGDSVDVPGAIACPRRDAGRRLPDARHARASGRPAEHVRRARRARGLARARGDATLRSQPTWPRARRVGSRGSRREPCLLGRRARSARAAGGGRCAAARRAPRSARLRPRAVLRAAVRGHDRGRPASATRTHTFDGRRRLQSLLVPKEKRLRPGLYKVRVTSTARCAPTATCGCARAV